MIVTSQKVNIYDIGSFWKSLISDNFAIGRVNPFHVFHDKDHSYCMDIVVDNLSEESFETIEQFSKESWQEMRQRNSFCDTILQTDDGGTFIVHRSVLSLCSPYFKTLFTTKINRPDRRWFHIPDINSDVLKEIINYAYCGSICLTEKNVLHLLIEADKFWVLDLMKQCCDFLLINMTVQNCLGMKNFASTFFCFKLENVTKRFLLNHFVEISNESEEFLELPITEIVEILNSDRINVKNEEQVWEAGLRWIDHRPDERKHHVPSIMQCVRLGLLDTQYFMDRIKQHAYVENNEMCKPIVIDTLKFLWDLDMIAETTEEIETPFLATPRIPNSIIFTIGGWSSGAPTSLIETYDTKADRWIRVDETDPDGPRAYHKLAVIGHNIYVIGGFNGNEYFSNCRCFNAVTKTWTDIAPLNAKRCYVSVATLNELIYAMGGYDGHNRQNTAERYDYHTNQWTYISPMNVQRSDASATTLNGFIYIVGGFNGSECLGSCEYYDPSLDQWTTVAPMRQRRSGISIISHHGKIFAFGGFNGISRLSNGESYDPETNQWTDLHDMFYPRSNFAIEVIDDMIFVMGGFNGVSTIFHVECFDNNANEWFEATDMNSSRSALAACVVSDLPNVDDYIHQNRQGLMEEKRQKLLQHQQRVRDYERERLGVGPHHPFLRQILPAEDEEDE